MSNAAARQLYYCNSDKARMIALFNINDRTDQHIPYRSDGCKRIATRLAQEGQLIYELFREVMLPWILLKVVFSNKM